MEALLLQLRHESRSAVSRLSEHMCETVEETSFVFRVNTSCNLLPIVDVLLSLQFKTYNNVIMFFLLSLQPL